MRTLQQCLFPSGNSFAGRRLVYSFNPSSVDAYREFQKATVEAGKLEAAEKMTPENMSPPDHELGLKADDAISACNAKSQEAEKDAEKALQTSYSEKETAILNKYSEDHPQPVKQGKEMGKWTKDYEAMVKQTIEPLHKERDAAVKAMHDSFSQDREVVTQRINQMRDGAIAQLKAAATARKAVNEKVKEQVLKSVAAGLDQEEENRLDKAADRAEDIGDDDTVGAGIVDDYLDSSLGDVEFKDIELENMTMGICMQLNPEGADDDNGADVKFMRSLEKREDKGGGLLNGRDDGVNAEDLRLQILESMGLPVGTRDDRQATLDTPSAKLVAEIMGNKDIPPQLRGTLLEGMLNNSKGDLAARTQETMRMYTMLKNFSEMENVKNVENLPLEEQLALSALIALTPGLLKLGPLAAVQVYAQEEALMNAGKVMLILQDAMAAAKFTEALSLYEQFKAVTGSSDETVDKIVAEASTPGKMRKALPGLVNAIKAAEEKYRKNVVDDFRKLSYMQEAHDIYHHFGFPEGATPFILGLTDLIQPSSLTEFVAKKQEYDKKFTMDSLMSYPALVARAEEQRTKVNKAIADIREYQKKHEEGSKYRYNKTMKDIPQIAASFTDISAGTPKEIKDRTLAQAEALKAASDIYNTHHATLDEIIKTKGRHNVAGSGPASGGGGAPEAPNPSAPTPAPAPDSPATIERVDNANKAIKIDNNSPEFGKIATSHEPENNVAKIPSPVQTAMSNVREDGTYKITQADGTVYYASKVKDVNTNKVSEAAYYYKPKTAPTPPTMTAQNPGQGPAEGPNPGATS